MDNQIPESDEETNYLDDEDEAAHPLKSLHRDKDSEPTTHPQPVVWEPAVICIGAGPVGLWTAIQTKLVAPTANILICEKYKEYQRSHVLRLKQSSFKHATHDPRLDQLISAIPEVVRTNELEDMLLSFAKELGIRIAFETVASTAELTGRFPTAKVIIGADGSHSVARKIVCNNELSVQETLQCTIEVKYEVEGTATKLNRSQVIALLSRMGVIGEEHFGKMRDGKYDGMLRCVWSHTDRTSLGPPGANFSTETYDQMKDAVFKTPYRLEKDKARMPDFVYRAMKIWLNAKVYWTGERRLPGEKITALKLSVYAARAVAVEIPANPSSHFQHVNVFLVGDAAFGVPFFRALNNGVLCANHLAQTVARLVDPSIASNFSKFESSIDSIFESTSFGSYLAGKFKMTMTNRGDSHSFEYTPAGYEQFYQALSQDEISTAHSKRNYLRLLILANKLNGILHESTDTGSVLSSVSTASTSFARVEPAELAILEEDKYLSQPDSMPRAKQSDRRDTGLLPSFD